MVEPLSTTPYKQHPSHVPLTRCQWHSFSGWRHPPRRVDRTGRPSSVDQATGTSWRPRGRLPTLRRRLPRSFDFPSRFGSPERLVDTRTLRRRDETRAVGGSARSRSLPRLVFVGPATEDGPGFRIQHPTSKSPNRLSGIFALSDEPPANSSRRKLTSPFSNFPLVLGHRIW